MTAINQQPVNIRKSRIMEAVKEDSEETMSCLLDLSTPAEENSAREELKNNRISTDKDMYKIYDMKLKVLETWEVSKRNAIEKLMKEVEELQKLENQIEKLEEFLVLHNIEINENDFETFCQSQTAKEEMDLFSDLQPQTPTRLEQQTKRHKAFATSIPITRKTMIDKFEIADKFVADTDGKVVIGPNGTKINKTALQAINWSLSGAALTRKILMEVFGREILAFHTLTGKPSPAFIDCDKPMKNQLDPLKVADVIHLVMRHTPLTAKEVRNAITTKCADENKMFRQREKKRLNATLKLKH